MEYNSSMALTTTLDPRFKLLHFRDPLAKTKVVRYLNEFVKDVNKIANKSNSFDELEKRLDFFCCMKIS